MTAPQSSEGLEGVVAGQTAICTLAGQMLYRGYAIEDLAALATFEEVAYLLLHGELPNRAELTAFRERLAGYSTLPPPVVEALRLIPKSAPLMDVMRTGCSLLAHFDPDVADDRRDALLRKAERLTALLPLVMTTAHRLRTGREPRAADPTLSIAADILQLVRDREPEAHEVRAMDVSLILYAEHELNASTFTARVVSSTLADLHSAITAAIGALKGPLHGGANERVLDVLAEVRADGDAARWIRNALAAKRRIMGFGHRVYKEGDPRSKILKPYCEELARRTGNEALEAMADVVERTITTEKRLPANVDWPSGRLYHYLGLPVELYTPLFVCARVSGWSAHAIEQHENNRLIRPAAEYVGPQRREFLEIDDRP